MTPPAVLGIERWLAKGGPVPAQRLPRRIWLTNVSVDVVPWAN